MPLGRQRLLQRFFNLHHCIATTRAKPKRTANATAKTRITPHGGEQPLSQRRQRRPASSLSYFNRSSDQVDQFPTYALRTLAPIGARATHAIELIGKQTKRRKAHGERYHERHKQNRELHDRPLSAIAKAPIVCSPREFRERIKPFSTSAGKVQFAGIIMPHERKTHAKRRSKMKFNF